jgi:hypothetical protein
MCGFPLPAHNAGNNVPIRRMLDELIRQGKNNERILIYMATENPEYVPSRNLNC